MEKTLLMILVFGTCACTPAIEQRNVAVALDKIGAMADSTRDSATLQVSTTNCNGEMDSAVVVYFKMSASLVYTMHIYRDSIRSCVDAHATPTSWAVSHGPRSENLLCSLDTTITSEKKLSSRAIETSAIGDLEYDIDRIKVVGWRHDGTLSKAKIFIPEDSRYRQRPLQRLVMAVDSILALHQAGIKQE